MFLFITAASRKHAFSAYFIIEVQKLSKTKRELSNCCENEKMSCDLLNEN